MKTQKNILRSIVILSVMILCSFNKEASQTALYQKALTKLNNFNLIKDYKVYLKKKKAKDPIEYVYFPVTLNSGEKYRFYGIDDALLKGRIVITIYNNMKREFQVATTYNSSTKTRMDAIEFTSHSTGVFCIGLSFLDGEDGCGVAISSFKKE
ncbi:MAG: hypothetical protein M3R17_02430 [Bacteroidota bacterium]|nr:hypothetical protein [Bacteroidota bacterium]